MMNSTMGVTGIGASPFGDVLYNLIVVFTFVGLLVIVSHVIRGALIDIVKDGIKKGIEEYEESRKED